MSLSAVSRAMDSHPYDLLKNLCGNAQKLAALPTEVQDELRKFLPKNQEGYPPSTPFPTAFDEAIRTSAYQAIEEEDEMDQKCVLSMIRRVVSLMPTEKQEIEKSNPLFVLESMQGYVLQRKELEDWAKRGGTRLEAIQKVFCFIAYQLETLDFSNLELCEPPPFTSKMGLGSANCLDLSKNRLKKFPSNLGAVGNQLTVLLSENEITEIPAGVEGVDHLKIIHLDRNQISSFPNGLISFLSLQILSLAHNSIRTIEGVELPRALVSLDLHNNQIEAFPKKLKPLQHLERLILDDNQISDIPQNMEDLKNLKTLTLGSNRIRALPINIKGLESMEELSLVSNQIAVLPPNLMSFPSIKRLTLNHNHIDTIPDEVQFPKSLKLIHLWGNPVVNMPKEIKGLSCPVFSGLPFDSPWIIRWVD